MGKPPHERPASTDLADVIDQKPAHGVGHGQTGPGHATAGPSEDDRYGEGKVANDAHGRVIGVSVHDGRTRLAIGLGVDQGVHVGMEGIALDHKGLPHPFQVEEVRGGVSYGSVDASVEDMEGSSSVVINPSHKVQAAPKTDMHTRVIANSIEDGKTKIMLGMGPAQGVQIGMKGYLAGPSGAPHVHFEIRGVHSDRVAFAYVEATLDEVHAYSDVVLNPSH